MYETEAFEVFVVPASRICTLRAFSPCDSLGEVCLASTSESYGNGTLNVQNEVLSSDSFIIPFSEPQFLLKGFFSLKK